jgi:hypothetical protein
MARFDPFKNFRFRTPIETLPLSSTKSAKRSMKQAADQGFLRRLRFIVNFPLPGPIDRK